MMGVQRGALGVLCILAVVVLWVGSSELIQVIFDGADRTHIGFESPLFLTFYSTSLFTVYLTGFFFSKRWRSSWSWGRTVGGGRVGERAHVHANPLADEQLREETAALLDNQNDEPGGELAPTSAFETFKLAALFAPLWIAANLSFNTSLCRSCGTGTSVSSNTLLSSSSGVYSKPI
jgi:hypothetical protein